MVSLSREEGQVIIEENESDLASERYAANPMSIIVRLFAVSVLLVGGLDMMLSWRRGLEASWFFVALLLAGMMLYAMSWIMQSNKSKST